MTGRVTSLYCDALTPALDDSINIIAGPQLLLFLFRGPQESRRNSDESEGLEW